MMSGTPRIDAPNGRRTISSPRNFRPWAGYAHNASNSRDRDARRCSTAFAGKRATANNAAADGFLASQKPSARQAAPPALTRQPDGTRVTTLGLAGKPRGSLGRRCERRVFPASILRVTPYSRLRQAWRTAAFVESKHVGEFARGLIFSRRCPLSGRSLAGLRLPSSD